MTAPQTGFEAFTCRYHHLPANLYMDKPSIEDGPELWRIARDSKALDLNSPYSYLLWCRDYSSTTVVVRETSHTASRPVAFATGYIRPEQPQVLFVWQIAVDSQHRGYGVAGSMLDGLVSHTAATYGITTVEATISPKNAASEKLFTSFSRCHDAAISRETLFGQHLFPHTAHEPEILFRIGPLAPCR